MNIACTGSGIYQRVEICSTNRGLCFEVAELGILDKLDQSCHGVGDM
jgi:hypothetical protein